jgi:hypothetical protein
MPDAELPAETEGVVTDGVLTLGVVTRGVLTVGALTEGTVTPGTDTGVTGVDSDGTPGRALAGDPVSRLTAAAVPASGATISSPAAPAAPSLSLSLRTALLGQAKSFALNYPYLGKPKARG